jgi:hypothetical protein
MAFIFQVLFPLFSNNNMTHLLGCTCDSIEPDVGEEHDGRAVEDPTGPERCEWHQVGGVCLDESRDDNEGHHRYM